MKLNGIAGRKAIIISGPNVGKIVVLRALLPTQTFAGEKVTVMPSCDGESSFVTKGYVWEVDSDIKWKQVVTGIRLHLPYVGDKRIRLIDPDETEEESHLAMEELTKTTEMKIPEKV